LQFTLDSSGNDVQAKDKEGQPIIWDGQPLMKRIFNLRAISEIALANPRNRQFLADGVTAEQAGDDEKANKCYQDFLNAIQPSFNVNYPAAARFMAAKGDRVNATVRVLTTDKGTTIVFDDVTPVMVASAQGARKPFSLAEYLTPVSDPAKVIV
jgi:hypothetical protein